MGIKEDFQYYFDLSDDPIAASILCLTEAVNSSTEKLDHKICMGIRKGLFGAEAKHDESLKEWFPCDEEKQFRVKMEKLGVRFDSDGKLE